MGVGIDHSCWDLLSVTLVASGSSLRMGRGGEGAVFSAMQLLPASLMRAIDIL
jgi:hypothetical protein